jgi:hypothetical protein
MYKISLNKDLTIQDVFDTDIYLDDTVTTYPITDFEFQEIYQSGRHDFWQYKNGQVVESEFKQEIIKNEYNNQQKNNREKAYQLQSDPIFMKWQRQEATQQEWLDKIEQIKLEFPYQE